MFALTNFKPDITEHDCSIGSYKLHDFLFNITIGPKNGKSNYESIYCII